MLISPRILPSVTTWPLIVPLDWMPPKRTNWPLEFRWITPRSPWAATVPLIPLLALIWLIRLPRLMSWPEIPPPWADVTLVTPVMLPLPSVKARPKSAGIDEDWPVVMFSQPPVVWMIPVIGPLEEMLPRM